MKLYLIDDKVKQNAKATGKYVKQHVSQEEYRIANDTYVVPYDANYLLEVVCDSWDEEVADNLRSEDSKILKFKKGDIIRGASDDSFADIYVNDKLIVSTTNTTDEEASSDATITLLEQDINIYTPAPPIPHYDIYKVKDRQALPYKVFLTNRGGYYRSLVVSRTTELGWCA